VAVTFSDRRDRALERLDALQVPALAVSHLPNIRYLCGFTGSNALLLLTRRHATLFTDPRYAIQSSQECDVETRIESAPLSQALARLAARRRVPVLGFESAHLTYHAYHQLSEAAAKRFRLHPLQNLVEDLRSVKSAVEIDAIRASVQLNSAAYARALRRVKPGLTELDLAAEIEFQMKRLGAEGPAFETIVASGSRSALPHARPTRHQLGQNQLLLIDMGASLNGYTSDMTRVVHLGAPSRRASRLYAAVLEAQLAAIDAVRPGVPAGRVDAAARLTLRRHKLDQYFQHSTGHGLGLEIHETPRLGKKVTAPLVSGQVITIEPGAYIEGFGGVRIEDTVLVTPTGCEVLTPTPKQSLVTLG
jgi:Xaa-Pro aminopeptidase